MYRAGTLEMHVATCVFVGGSRVVPVRGQNFWPLRLWDLTRARARVSYGHARLVFGWRCDVTFLITQALVACGVGLRVYFPQTIERNVGVSLRGVEASMA